ncbi:MAG: quinol:electron acceptor oxidoreductase subunit ActD [Bryobacteraceae bacterium]
MYLRADFIEQTSTAQAIRELTAKGFGAGDIDVFSDEPIDFPHGLLDRPSRMSFATVTGAVVFCLLTIAFVYFTQHNYPLMTGGMPLFSFWATGVIFFELTMFGAIVTTFAWFLKESRLPRFTRRAPVPAVEPGIICLRVRCLPEQSDDVSRYLQRAGANNVTRIGDPE